MNRGGDQGGSTSRWIWGAPVAPTTAHVQYVGQDHSMGLTLKEGWIDEGKRHRVVLRVLSQVGSHER